MALVVLLLLVATRLVAADLVSSLDNNTTLAVVRFVHRHSCLVGADDDNFVLHERDGDTIGCAERFAKLLQHSLTPAMLWCSASECRSEFNNSYTVHSIDCNDRRCHVLVHCADALTELTHAFVLTMITVLVIVVSSVYTDTLQASKQRRTRRILETVGVDNTPTPCAKDGKRV